MDTQSDHYPISLPSFPERLPSISGSSSDSPFSPPDDPRSVARATSHIRTTTQGCRKEREDVRGQGDTGRQATTVSVLPDNVLLEIFYFYKGDRHQHALVWKWHFLAHVCQGWRQVVYASPLRLDLRILCTPTTPVRKNLGIWPALPIYVYYHRGHSSNASNLDNIVTALEHADRVCEVSFNVTGLELEKVSTVMREPFPVLTSLRIYSLEGHGIAPALPVEFLGGSAPCLQLIYLNGIPFPALPTLLLTTSELVSLDLRNIPRTGYISPEEMVVGLAALPRLRDFDIGFQSATPRPDRIHPPPVTRTVLPALTRFIFQGASEYLEDLVARIDAPQLDLIDIFYLNQFIDFQVAQLSMFVDRSVGPKLTPFRYARVTFDPDMVSFHTYRHANDSSPDSHHATHIFCRKIDWQVSHIAQVVSHFSATLSNVIHLKLGVQGSFQSEGTDDVEWLHLLHQFPTVQMLQVSRQIARHVALALEDTAGETVAEVLPSLDLICLEDQPASSIEKFVAARQLSGRPITVFDTEGEFYDRVNPPVSE